VFVEADIYHQ